MARVSARIISRTPDPRFWYRAKDAVTGEFVSLSEAMRRPSTTYVERVKRKNPKLN